MQVSLGECRCPGTPHDEDTVELRERLDFVAGRSLQALAFVLRSEELPVEAITARLDAAYVHHGVTAWNLENESGPIPVSIEAIDEHLLSDFTRAAPVADQADALYAPAVIHPLVNAAAKSSPTTMTAASTSQTKRGSSKQNRKPSTRSSTSTTRTVATATTTG